jgi:hypothetical protein
MDIVYYEKDWIYKNVWQKNSFHLLNFKQIHDYL